MRCASLLGTLSGGGGREVPNRKQSCIPQKAFTRHSSGASEIGIPETADALSSDSENTMKPVVLTVSIPATILSCQVNAADDVAEGPAADVPELQALNLYAGEWEHEIA